MERLKGGTDTRPRLGRDKKIHVNAAALVDLKAALFRKQQEYRREKGGQEGRAEESRSVSDKTAAIWRSAPTEKGKKRSAGGVSRGRGEREDASAGVTRLSAEEEAELAKSRQALEAKAALYERLCRGEGLREAEEEGGEEEGEGRYMVDFTRKVANELAEQGMLRSVAGSDTPGATTETTRVGGREVGEEDEGGGENEAAENSDDEWVDYVDSLGRSRRCLRKDLPHVTRLDQQLRRSRSPTPDLLSDDMRRERERRRWEEEQAQQEADLDKPVGPVHYQELQQGEIRTHGAGYYAFSTDEEKRQEQMNLLNKLKEQTAQQREKRQKLQQKRKAALEARLAKVRQRKLKQGGGGEEEGGGGEDGGGGGVDIAKFDFEGKKEEEEVKDGSAMSIKDKIDEELARVREKVEEEKRQAHVRPWDRGKVKDPIRKRKQELEDERLSEFAPPSSYSHKLPKRTKQETLRDERDEEPQADVNGSLESDSSNPAITVSTTVPLESAASPPAYFPTQPPPPHGQFVTQPPPPHGQFVTQPPPPPGQFVTPPPPPSGQFVTQLPPPPGQFVTPPPPPPGHFVTQPPLPPAHFVTQPPPPPGQFVTQPPPPPGHFVVQPPPPPGHFVTQPPPPPGHFATHPQPPPGQYPFFPPPPPRNFVSHPSPQVGQFVTQPRPPGAHFPPPPGVEFAHPPYTFPTTSYSSGPWQPSHDRAAHNQSSPNSS